MDSTSVSRSAYAPVTGLVVHQGTHQERGPNTPASREVRRVRFSLRLIAEVTSAASNIRLDTYIY